LNILLDTHLAIWATDGDRRLVRAVRDELWSGRHMLWVSAASVWEIAIKHALRRGTDRQLKLSGQQARDYFAEMGFAFLDISSQHAAAVDLLPPIHADPFDRMLIAQALIETMQLYTHDATLSGYGSFVTVV
jgi:PIN domain nuclease of toxin-antitoxin system